jgi:mono/diheme cytochrome c family protein
MRFEIQAVALAAALTLPGIAAAQTEKDIAYFKETCGACHGENGEGMKGLAPPLKGNAWVKGASDGDLASVITKGRMGDAKRHKDIPAPMPANSMSDNRLKGVIAYLKGGLQK